MLAFFEPSGRRAEGVGAKPDRYNLKYMLQKQEKCSENIKTKS